jgi:hypothetical protein
MKKNENAYENNVFDSETASRRTKGQNKGLDCPSRNFIVIAVFSILLLSSGNQCELRVGNIPDPCIGRQ